MSTLNQTSGRRKMRNRSKVRVASAGRPRLSIYRSSKYIYAQIIDDTAGKTVAQVAFQVRGNALAQLATQGK